MLTKTVLLIAWSICFVILNISAKKLVSGLVLNNGIWKLAVSVIFCKWTYVVVFFYGLTALLYLGLLRIMPISIAGPIILILGAVILTLVGWVVLKEGTFNLQNVLGLVLILLGYFLLQNSIKT